MQERCTKVHLDNFLNKKIKGGFGNLRTFCIHLCMMPKLLVKHKFNKLHKKNVTPTFTTLSACLVSPFRNKYNTVPDK